VTEQRRPTAGRGDPVEPSREKLPPAGRDLCVRKNGASRSKTKLGGLTLPLRLVIFDCDGVLIDSEPVVNRVMAEELTRLGWPMTSAESCARFLGLDLDAMVPLIEAALDRALPAPWRQAMQTQIAEALQTDAPMVPGACVALEATTALGLPWRVASNSSHGEMQAKFGRNGLLETVAGRLHSFTDVARGKPAPDLFLAAAAAEGVSPGECLVIEDSVPGVTGAMAAGMACLGLARHGDGATLAAAGAVLFHSLFDLPELLRAALASRN
jgi:beta-phosphoglucomutase-like phosphatase (HAD superfamily)